MSSQSAKVLKNRAMEHGEAKWIQLRAIEWRDPSGKERKWEAADRTTRNGDVDGAWGRGGREADGMRRGRAWHGSGRDSSATK
jgi:hypothetical protein